MVKIGKYVNLLFSLEVNVRVCMGMYVLLYIYPHFSVDDHERYSNMKLLCLKIWNSLIFKQHCIVLCYRTVSYLNSRNGLKVVAQAWIVPLSVHSKYIAYLSLKEYPDVSFRLRVSHYPKLPVINWYCIWNKCMFWNNI